MQGRASKAEEGDVEGVKAWSGGMKGWTAWIVLEKMGELINLID